MDERTRITSSDHPWVGRLSTVLVESTGVASLSQRVRDFCAAPRKKIGNLNLLHAAYFLSFAAIFFTNADKPTNQVYDFLVLPIGIVVAYSFARRTVLTSTTFWAVAAYLLALGFSSLFLANIPSRDIATHFRSIPLILSFLIVTAYLTSRPRVEFAQVILGCTLIVAISALINMVSFVIQQPVSLADIRHYRLAAALGMPGYFNSTNISATYAIYCMAGFALLIDETSRWNRALMAAAATLLSAAVMMTQSRGAYIALVAGAFVLSVGLSMTSRLILMAAMVVVAGAAALAVDLVPHVADIVIARGSSYRPELWASYLAMAAERPLFGYGIQADISRVMADGTVIDQPHNIVLSALIRGGVAGAAAMTILIASGLYWAARYWWQSNNIIPLCLLVTMATASMFDYQLLATGATWPWVTFWFPISACIAAEGLVRGSTKLPSDPGMTRREPMQ
jgi:O-antigen ligase